MCLISGGSGGDFKQDSTAGIEVLVVGNQFVIHTHIDYLIGQYLLPIRRMLFSFFFLQSRYA